MLDRKTKDYEASDELIEDRVKQTKIISGGYYILYIMFLLFLAYISINVINIDFSAAKETTLWRLIFVTMIAGFLFTVISVYALVSSINYDNTVNYYKLLIFIRKQKEKRKP